MQKKKEDIQESHTNKDTGHIVVVLDLLLEVSNGTEMYEQDTMTIC